MLSPDLEGRQKDPREGSSSQQPQSDTKSNDAPRSSIGLQDAVTQTELWDEPSTSADLDPDDWRGHAKVMRENCTQIHQRIRALSMLEAKLIDHHFLREEGPDGQALARDALNIMKRQRDLEKEYQHCGGLADELDERAEIKDMREKASKAGITKPKR
ncbi:hypothetical protein MMC06_000816 [Schaereria dolodes]|nr:hypothetical protein [Schaereria dolodes]